MPNSRKIAFWRTAFLTGGALLLVGLGSMYTDYSFRGGIEVIDDHFGAVLSASIVGMLLSAICLAGWAKQLRRRGRAKIGALTSLISVVICGLATTIGGTNVHGPLFFLCLLIFPVFLVGLLVWLIAAFSKN